MTAAARSRSAGGVALLVVLVMILLSALLAWVAAHQALLSETLAGQEVDESLALAAAQALLRDAERDVLGLRVEGQPCQTPSGVLSCRDPSDGPTYPVDVEAFAALVQRLAARTPPCEKGICLGLGDAVSGESSSFWWQAGQLKTWVEGGGGVPYGRYTGARSTGGGSAWGDDLDLLQVSANRGAWYWVEVLPYQVGSSAFQASAARGLSPLAPLPAHPFVYRITAVVQGRTASTAVVLQSVLVRQALGGV